MAIIERLGENLPLVHLDDGLNPYALDINSPEVIGALHRLIRDEKPYIDDTTNPEIASGDTKYAVYNFDSNHEASLIVKAIEGNVIIDDWEQDPELTKQEAESYENNSIHFLVVDTTDPNNPKPAVSLRVADCLHGGSSTVDFFTNSYNADENIPVELQVNPEDLTGGLWDVVGVMAPRNYRNGMASVWAYHALYKNSIESGVHRWISCIADKEFANLDALGIPFKPVEDMPKVRMPIKGKKGIDFGFYTANVDEIRNQMMYKIYNLESSNDYEENELFKLISRLARIALNGQSIRNDETGFLATNAA